MQFHWIHRLMHLNDCLGIILGTRHTGIAQTIVKDIVIPNLLSPFCRVFTQFTDNGFAAQHCLVNFVYHLLHLSFPTCLLSILRKNRSLFRLRRFLFYSFKLISSIFYCSSKHILSYRCAHLDHNLACFMICLCLGHTVDFLQCFLYMCLTMCTHHSLYF